MYRNNGNFEDLTALAEVFYLAAAEFPHKVRMVVDPDKILNTFEIHILEIIFYCCDSVFKKSKHRCF